MANFVTLKRGGQPGHVAINVDLVTDIRSSLGPFTDVFCGDHQITVEGTFEQVVALMCGTTTPKKPQAGPFARIG
jgi:hypothetical protein